MCENVAPKVVDYGTANRFHCEELGSVKRYRQTVLLALAQLQPEEFMKAPMNDALVVTMRVSFDIDTARRLIAALQKAVNGAGIHDDGD